MSNEKKMENEIKVFNGEKKILKTTFNTSFYTVRQALGGKANTKLRKEIRQEAISRGGKEIILLDEIESPEHSHIK